MSPVPAPSPPGSGAVFALGASAAGQLGPVAALVSTAGWAAAAERCLGAAWIATPGGVIDPSEAARRGSAPTLASDGAHTARRRVPTVAKTLAKDVRSWRRARSFSVPTAGPWSASAVRFVWQRHELFHTAGIDLAQRLGVPSVLFAPATVVWEAEQWGVRRPGWRGLAERRGEAPALRGADLVAAGSEPVAEQAIRLGVDPARILITPTGVDLTPYLPPAAAGVAADPTVNRRTELGLADRFVVGWVGSFRGFHGVERSVDAVADLPHTTLLLVGDGPGRAAVEAAARARGVHVVCTGTVAHQDLPGYLAVFDVALVLTPPDGAFHYSPLKLAEYLAAGRAVVAPAVPQLTERLTHDRQIVFVPPGDGDALARAVRDLRDDPARRHRLGRAAHDAAVADWSWDRQIERIVNALAALPARIPDGGGAGEGS